MEADAWTVVGGSGRARSSQKGSSLQVKPSKSAASEKLTAMRTDKDLPGWDVEPNINKESRHSAHSGSTKGHPPTLKQLNPHNVQDAADSGPDPVIQPPTATLTSTMTPAPRNRRTASARVCQVTTPEQQVARLVSQVEECRCVMLCTLSIQACSFCLDGHILQKLAQRFPTSFSRFCCVAAHHGYCMSVLTCRTFTGFGSPFLNVGPIERYSKDTRALVCWLECLVWFGLKRPFKHPNQVQDNQRRPKSQENKSSQRNAPNNCERVSTNSLTSW